MTEFNFIEPSKVVVLEAVETLERVVSEGHYHLNVPRERQREQLVNCNFKGTRGICLRLQSLGGNALHNGDNILLYQTHYQRMLSKQFTSKYIC